MTIDITQYQGWIAILVGVVLPAVVALVTKELASSKFKNTVLLALSAVSAVVVPLAGATSLDLKQFATSFLTIFGTAVLAYVGVYKPRGTTAAVQAAVPGGLGTTVVEDEFEEPDPADGEIVDVPDDTFDEDTSEDPYA